MITQIHDVSLKFPVYSLSCQVKYISLKQIINSFKIWDEIYEMNYSVFAKIFCSFHCLFKLEKTMWIFEGYFNFPKMSQWNWIPLNFLIVKLWARQWCHNPIISINYILYMHFTAILLHLCLRSEFIKTSFSLE